MRAESILATLFGRAQAKELARDPWPATPIVGHGPVSRLPVEMASGTLSSLERLSDSYQGKLTASRNVGSRQRTFLVEGASALDCFLAGLTILFEDVTVPSILPWKGRLEREIGIPSGICRLAGFASPKGPTSGLLPHWDEKEGLLIQIQGRKRIHVAPNHHVELPSLGYNPGGAVSEELAREFSGGLPEKPPRGKSIELGPGSVIYLPRGYWHATEALEDSLAIAVDFAWPTMVDVLLPRLRMHLLRDRNWRRPLFGAWRNEESFSNASAELSRLLTKLPEHIDDLAPEDVLGSVEDLDTRFRFLRRDAEFVRQVVRYSLEPVTRGVFDLHLTWYQQFGTTTIRVERKYVGACEWILRRRRRFTVAEFSSAFPRLTTAGVRRVLKALVTVNAIQFAGKRGRRVARRPSSARR